MLLRGNDGGVHLLRKWRARAVVTVALAAIAVGCGTATKVETVTVSTSSGQPTATVQGESTTTTQPAATPCAKYKLTEHTSCPFAQAVVKAYDAAPSTAVQAYSPVTQQTYTMQCVEARGVVSCTGGNDAGVAFQGPPVPGATNTTATATSSSQSVEGAGSYDHSTDTQFCSMHQCIPNFPNGNGYIVQCTDGEWSHSGGVSGACSYHGGVS